VNYGLDRDRILFSRTFSKAVHLRAFITSANDQGFGFVAFLFFNPSNPIVSHSILYFSDKSAFKKVCTFHFVLLLVKLNIFFLVLLFRWQGLMFASVILEDRESVIHQRTFWKNQFFLIRIPYRLEGSKTEKAVSTPGLLFAENLYPSSRLTQRLQKMTDHIHRRYFIGSYFPIDKTFRRYFLNLLSIPLPLSTTFIIYHFLPLTRILFLSMPIVPKGCGIS